TRAYIVMDPEVHRIIEQGHSWRQYMRPRYLPMIVEPYPWQPEAQGGYVRIRTPFISKPTKSQKAALKDVDLSQVYECLNAVSATPWRVNRRVYETIQQVWDMGGAKAGVPRADNLPMPPKPHGFDENEEIKAQ